MTGDALHVITVLIADDGDDVRAAVSEVVRRDSRLQLAAAVPDGMAAQDAAERYHPSVAVLDVRMPGGGPQLVHAVKSASPDTAVIAYTSHNDPITERQMRDAGACTFLVKGDRQVDLAQAIADAAPAAR